MRDDIDPPLWRKLRITPANDPITVRVYPNQRSDFEIIEAYLEARVGISSQSQLTEGYISIAATGPQIERLAEQNAVQRIELDVSAVDDSVESGPSGQPVDVQDVESDFSITNDVTEVDPQAIDIGRPIPLDQFRSAKEAADIPDAGIIEVDADTEEE